MILGIIVILLALAIAFIHFIQGFFSATISLILVIVSIAVAFGSHDVLVNLMKPGKFADTSTASILCVVFAITYVILRVIFDKAIPGNVRLNPTVDKVGAGAMGLLAGCLVAGLIAVVMQSMPFDAGSMEARYAEIPERQAGGSYKENDSQIERLLLNQMKSPKFDQKDVTSLIIPADDWVVGLVSTLSNGTLSTGRKWTDVHPDYLQELFGQRIGIQPGTKHVATNFPNGNSQISVEHIYVPPVQPLTQDGEIVAVRKSEKDWVKEAGPKDKKDYVLIVRVKVSTEAADASTNIFSFSPGSARLLVRPETGPPQNIYPMGTMEGSKIWLNRVDDYLFADGKGDSEIDLVYPIDNQNDILDIQKDSKTGQQTVTIKDGVMLEMKRLARMDLSGMQAELAMPPAITGAGMVRKQILKPEKKG